MAGDSDGEEDFVSYGTALEPLEEDEPLKKPIPLHEQTVTDEKGRYKRFHGAFTGGFSAGYFNTVGSKEGWTPSTFKSSRQQKAEKQNARFAKPEDYMDEEDFGEHGIAPTEIHRSDEFASSCRNETAEMARAVNAQASLIPGDTLLEGFIKAASSSIGVELLRRMGWKEGQGVGPRVKRKARKQTGQGSSGYGCAMPPGGSEESEDDEEFAPENVTFAPKDVTPVDFTPRLGVQGLGYRGLDPGMALLGQAAPEHIDLFRPQSESRSKLFGESSRGKKRGGVAGQAFGIGALEDDDDEEVYHKDSMSRYDVVLGEEDPGDGLFGWTAPQQYGKTKGRSRDASYLGKILEGFTLAQKPVEQKTIFPPPILPRDYRPTHRRSGVEVSRMSGISSALAEALKTSRGHMVTEEPQKGGRHQLDSSQRAALLGESPQQAGSGSIMDLLKPEDRQRLLNLRNTSIPPAAQTPAPITQSTLKAAVAMAAGAAAAASSGLRQQQEALVAWKGKTSTQSFKPFENIPSKQARYEQYVTRLKQGDGDALEHSLDTGMTEWERSREREEFVRASILYRPSSSSLSSRFTSAKTQDDDNTVEVSRDEEVDVDDKAAAAKMKMFGKLTRETFEWHPDKLMCKRFNCPDPYPESGMVGLPTVKRDKFSVFNFLTVSDSQQLIPPKKPPEPVKKSRWDMSERKQSDPLSEMLSTARNQSECKQEPEEPPDDAPPAVSETVSSSHNTADKKIKKKSADQESSDEEDEEEEEEEEEDEEEEEESRPPMDLFKAIFSGSSDKDSSSSEEEDDKAEEEKKGKLDANHLNLFSISTASVPTPTTTASASASASTPTASASTATASGSTPTVTTASSSSLTAAQNQAPQEEEEEFGPKLPPPSAAFYTGGVSTQEESPSRKSKEKKHKKKKKHHKHKKDKKKKKEKKKHKQQKKSKTETSESSDEDDEEEKKRGKEDNISSDKLLQRLKSIRSLQS